MAASRSGTCPDRAHFLRLFSRRDIVCAGNYAELRIDQDIIDQVVVESVVFALVYEEIVCICERMKVVSERR